MEKQSFYYNYVHPAAHWFWNNIAHLYERALFSMFVAFILTLVAKIYPICTDKFCYTIFAQIFFNLSLLVKPFAFNMILIPAFYTFAILTIVWFGIFTVCHAVQRSGVVHELVIPIIAALIFIYLAFVVSGTMGMFFLQTGLVECVNNEDCLRAGYVGEVCTSVYRPVYTEYSPDMAPLQKCSCIANKCVGS